MSSVGTWKVTLQLFDHEDTTAAHAVLTTDTGTVHGHGRAKRNPSDLAVPEIGVELAAARALRDLADHLLRITSDDISEVQHEQHVHLTH
ncbi:MAG TPA: dsRBD fold-containing protein [Actinomycetales bacterium]|nr:dsRBD fold-containing protein [Actinomycetales bacterium]